MHDGHPSESGLLRRVGCIHQTEPSPVPSNSSWLHAQTFRLQDAVLVHHTVSSESRNSSFKPHTSIRNMPTTVCPWWFPGPVRYVANSREKKSLHHGFLGNISGEAAMSGPPALHSNGDSSRLRYPQNHIPCRGSILLKSALKRRAVILEISDKPAFGLLVVPDQLQVDVHLAKHRLHCE
jgi:hypothetical protein